MGRWREEGQGARRRENGEGTGRFGRDSRPSAERRPVSVCTSAFDVRRSFESEIARETAWGLGGRNAGFFRGCRGWTRMRFSGRTPNAQLPTPNAEVPTEALGGSHAGRRPETTA